MACHRPEETHSVDVLRSRFVRAMGRCRDRSEGYNGSKADVWSAGILLYTLASGLRPFQEREDDQETTIMSRATNARHVEALFVRLQGLGASAELISLLRGMLCADANRRLSMLEVRRPVVAYSTRSHMHIQRALVCMKAAKHAEAEYSCVPCNGR